MPIRIVGLVASPVEHPAAELRGDQIAQEEHQHQPDVDQRLGGPQLEHDERRKQYGACRQAGPRRRAVPTPNWPTELTARSPIG
jgi:hypothetical protein